MQPLPLRLLSKPQRSGCTVLTVISTHPGKHLQRLHREDGLWPAGDAERIEAALAACGLELWEMYGHGPDATQMWSDKYTRWKDNNPPPLNVLAI